MGTKAGLSLFIFLIKAMNDFAAGSPINPVRQKYPTPLLSSEGKNAFEYEYHKCAELEGTWDA